MDSTALLIQGRRVISVGPGLAVRTRVPLEFTLRKSHYL